MYFASSAILKRHGRLATFRHSHSFHSNVKDVSRSIYFTLVETFRVRNILYLNAVRQVIHRCLQMLQVGCLWHVKLVGYHASDQLHNMCIFIDTLLGHIAVLRLVRGLRGRRESAAALPSSQRVAGVSKHRRCYALPHSSAAEGHLAGVSRGE